MIEVRRGSDRFVTRTNWLDSRQSFSFGEHYDPANVHFGLLLANNDDLVTAGSGFDPHPHRDLEIVTWVLEGSLVHEDSNGHSGVIYPGLAQRMSAGTGIVHSERNDAWRRSDEEPHDRPVRFVQMWVRPDESSTSPGYEQREVDDDDLSAGLVPVASGMATHRVDAAIRIGQQDAALHAARLRIGQVVVVPSAPFVHLYVARGAVELEGAGPLDAGDAARISAAEGQRVTASEPGEVLVWEMHSTL